VVTLRPWNGTTASPHAPSSEGFVDNGRAPESGTAAHASPGLGSGANPATSTTDGVDAIGWDRPHRLGAWVGSVWFGWGTARPSNEVS
jgi:hypothetical protein